MRTYKLSPSAPDHLRLSSLALRSSSRDSAPCRIAVAWDPDGIHRARYRDWPERVAGSLEDFRQRAGALLHGPDTYRGSK